MTASLAHEWFGWPAGAVLTNLVASLIWGGLAWQKLHAIHKHVRRNHEHLTRIHRHLGMEDE